MNMVFKKADFNIGLEIHRKRMALEQKIKNQK